MSLPGEEHAYWVLHSNITSASDKAEASVKLANIAEIKRRNEEAMARYRAGREVEAAQARARQGICPTCGRGPDAERS